MFQFTLLFLSLGGGSRFFFDRFAISLGKLWRFFNPQKNRDPVKSLFSNKISTPQNPFMGLWGGVRHPQDFVRGGEVLRHSLGGGNSNIFYFHPEPWGRWSILTSIFFRWVGSTTNQFRLQLIFFYFLEFLQWIQLDSIPWKLTNIPWKALLVSLNKALLGPYFLGGVALGGVP